MTPTTLKVLNEILSDITSQLERADNQPEGDHSLQYVLDALSALQWVCEADGGEGLKVTAGIVNGLGKMVRGVFGDLGLLVEHVKDLELENGVKLPGPIPGESLADHLHRLRMSVKK
jgi:hypothetical protein